MIESPSRGSTKSADALRVNVLVVDDQPDKLLSLEAVLGGLGENIVTARSGREALRRLLEQDFAVILLDVNMPDMDGFETAAMIRQHRRCAKTPIIFVTAFGDDIHTAQGYSLGAVDYILSPVVPDILRTKVSVFVDLFRKTEEVRRYAEERIGMAREQAARAAAEESNRQLSFLTEATAAITQSLNRAVTIRGLNRVVVPFLADFSTIALLDERGRVGQIAAAWTDESDQRHSAETDDGSETTEPLAAAIDELLVAVPGDRLQRATATLLESQQLARLQEHLAATLFSAALLPIFARGRTIGAILLACREPRCSFSPGHLLLAEDLAGRAGIAIDNARLYENVQEHDRRKDDFLAMLGHELRNPLAPIRNAVEILRLGGAMDPVAAQARDMIDRQAGHMSRLIDDLLDISRIARGKIQLRKERCDVTRIVRDMVEDSRVGIEQGGLRLHVELPDEPVWVMSDATRLSQVVGNLLHNAHKFTDEGGEIRVRLTAQASGSVQLGIRDSGIGMDRETLSAAFDAFTQADRSLARSRGGLGLGLALVKGLVELHGGTVRAASEGLGHGSEFSVQLPVESLPLEDLPERSPLKSTGPTLRVLVIEDNVDGAESMRMLLNHMRHETQVALTGPAGVAAARGWRPEVVLCDIGLPGGMDGYAVARALRQEPGLAGTMLIALTGYGQEDDQRRAHEAGFDRHMTKPVNIFELSRTLASFGSDAKENDANGNHKARPLAAQPA